MTKHQIKKNYHKKDGSCSAACLEEMKACKMYGRSLLNGDACVFLTENLTCISPEAYNETNQLNMDNKIGKVQQFDELCHDSA